jgi:hypothetical protein
MEFQNWIGKIFFMAMMSDQARLACILHCKRATSSKHQEGLSKGLMALSETKCAKSLLCGLCVKGLILSIRLFHAH